MDDPAAAPNRMAHEISNDQVMDFVSNVHEVGGLRLESVVMHKVVFQILHSCHILVPVKVDTWKFPQISKISTYLGVETVNFQGGMDVHVDVRERTVFFMEERLFRG